MAWIVSSLRNFKIAFASPRSYGQVERSNWTILESLSPWSTRNATSGSAQSELLYGCRSHVPAEVKCKIMKENLFSVIRKLPKKKN